MKYHFLSWHELWWCPWVSLVLTLHAYPMDEGPNGWTVQRLTWASSLLALAWIWSCLWQTPIVIILYVTSLNNTMELIDSPLWYAATCTSIHNWTWWHQTMVLTDTTQPCLNLWPCCDWAMIFHFSTHWFTLMTSVLQFHWTPVWMHTYMCCFSTDLGIKLRLHLNWEYCNCIHVLCNQSMLTLHPTPWSSCLLAKQPYLNLGARSLIQLHLFDDVWLLYI